MRIKTNVLNKGIIKGSSVIIRVVGHTAMRVTNEILRVKGLDCCGKLAPPYQPRRVLFSYNLIVLKQCTVYDF